MPPSRRTLTGTGRKPTSSVSRARRLGLGALVGGPVGVGLAAWLLSRFGVLRILEVLVRVGWPGMVLISLFHLPQMVCSALGWQAIAASDGSRQRLRTYLRLRWVREAVNNLLPLAQIGGEIVVIRLLRRRGVPLASAVGGTSADLMMEMATQVLFTLLGVALLVRVADHTETADVLTKGLLFAALIVAALFAAVWLGLAAVIEKAVLRMGRSLGWPATAASGGLHAALVSCYRSPGRVARSALWHLASWLLGGVEVCLVLHFCGHEVELGTGMIIESLGQAAKAAGFAVPGAIGVQEGGLVVVCGLLGIAPEVALALSLVKRLREVVLGLPGLVVWHRTESMENRAEALS
jgi:putative membrane protein